MSKKNQQQAAGFDPEKNIHTAQRPALCLSTGQGVEPLMQEALRQADQAAQKGEVPVGALVTDTAGNIVSRAGNASISRHDPTAHAEILALRQAAARRGNYRLTDCLVIVTLEPCLMCLGAMVHARIAGLVYGTADPKAGAVTSQINALELPFLNHRFPVLPNVLAKESATLLRTFFQHCRHKNKSMKQA